MWSAFLATMDSTYYKMQQGLMGYCLASGPIVFMIVDKPILPILMIQLRELVTVW